MAKHRNLCKASTKLERALRREPSFFNRSARQYDPPLRWTRPTRETPKRQFDELRWERRPTRKLSAEELESITTCEAAAKDLKLVVAFGLIFAAFGCFIALVGGVARTAVPLYKRM